MNQIKSVLYITLLQRDVNLSFWSKKFFSNYCLPETHNIFFCFERLYLLQKQKAGISKNVYCFVVN